MKKLEEKANDLVVVECEECGANLYECGVSLTHFVHYTPLKKKYGTLYPTDESSPDGDRLICEACGTGLSRYYFDELDIEYIKMKSNEKDVK